MLLLLLSFDLLIVSNDLDIIPSLSFLIFNADSYVIDENTTFCRFSSIRYGEQ